MIVTSMLPIIEIQRVVQPQQPLWFSSTILYTNTSSINCQYDWLILGKEENL